MRRKRGEADEGQEAVEALQRTAARQGRQQTPGTAWGPVLHSSELEMLGVRALKGCVCVRGVQGRWVCKMLKAVGHGLSMKRIMVSCCAALLLAPSGQPPSGCAMCAQRPPPAASWRLPCHATPTCTLPLNPLPLHYPHPLPPHPTYPLQSFPPYRALHGAAGQACRPHPPCPTAAAAAATAAAAAIQPFPHCTQHPSAGQ